MILPATPGLEGAGRSHLLLRSFTEVWDIFRVIAFLCFLTFMVCSRCNSRRHLIMLKRLLLESIIL
jgi:hypothetical protein